ncbi:NADH-ubiquinone oxidoreductase chain 5-like [Bombus affinis]|uniref:NADH-ubiquinone oxidoreductase chain 5-like n=1 Tax=Bombus affinis TaxID=309941 RepID=UPI0021B8373E|nr:NADH-ubiquinone oxidoreductase chain 5-like [Bombus affinis]
MIEKCAINIYNLITCCNNSSYSCFFLVHSSTLVTAGIYLLINYDILIDLKYKEYILIVSRITIFISGVIANFEIDFKKIIALSTLSQLGFIIRIFSLGIVNLTFLHLFIHAFFKSIIFICVGSYIHYIRGIQNFRFYFGIYYVYPIKGLLIIFSLFILCGFPFLVGYFSKDLIIEYYFLNIIRIFRLLNLIIGTIFTVSYSFRLINILIINYFIINLIYFDEDRIIITHIIFILLIILFIRKFIYNFFFFLLELICFIFLNILFLK